MSSESAFDPARLAALQKKTAALKLSGSKAPIRRKVVPKQATSQDDSKLRNQLKKLNVQGIGPVDEVNMFKDDGVLHFQRPTVHAAAGNNTFAIYGHGVHKDLAEMMPSVINQLGPDTMAVLQRIAEQYKLQNGAAGAAEGDAQEADEVPELVEAEPAQEGAKLEDLN
ncbi:Nascent polypeptide-associated complex subunit beta [Rhodotorula kratochvilovae]